MIIDKARELALLIIETDEYKKLKEAEVEFETDTRSRELMDEFNALQSSMLEDLKGDADKEAVDAAKAKLMDKQKEINDYEVTQKFMLARSGFEALMQQVNQVIAFVVSGEEEQGQQGGHQCGGCGGCGGA